MVKGFIKETVTSNPVFVLALGLCPALAITTSVDNALGLGAAVAFVLVVSSLLVALMKRLIPASVKLYAFVIIIAAFTTIISMLYQVYLPALHKSLGIYLPLVAAYCIILSQLENFAWKSPVRQSSGSGLKVSFGFLLALLIISLFREVLGTGRLNIFGSELFTLPVINEHPITIFILPMGAFLIMGLLMGLFRWTGVVRHE